MPITKGSVSYNGTGITVQCGTQAVYDKVKADEAARGVYTLTNEDIPNLTLTYSVNNYVVSINDGTLP
jgi:hypothetical protein